MVQIKCCQDISYGLGVLSLDVLHSLLESYAPELHEVCEFEEQSEHAGEEIEAQRYKVATILPGVHNKLS